MSIYEVHLGSWRRPDDPAAHLPRARAAAGRARAGLGFTHVELMPVMEHPFYGSWGYQTTGYFAPTSRFGTPEDLMFLVDTLHQAGIGVILDWVPSHFPTDEHGLAYFDGTHLYEHADPRQGFHPDWKSRSSTTAATRCAASCSRARCSGSTLPRRRPARRRRGLDALPRLLARGRRVGPEPHGGARTSRRSSSCAAQHRGVPRHPDVQTIAEESTAWPMVTAPGGSAAWASASSGTWAGCTTRSKYMRATPSTASSTTASSPSAPLRVQRELRAAALARRGRCTARARSSARCRATTGSSSPTCACCYAPTCGRQPGKKLLFMGGELGQWREWNHDDSLDWHLLDDPGHAGISAALGDLNRLYRERAGAARARLRPAGLRVGRLRHHRRVLPAQQRGPHRRRRRPHRRHRPTTTST
jgi:1,4-alpha-glucan branching enzyme